MQLSNINKSYTRITYTDNEEEDLQKLLAFFLAIIKNHKILLLDEIDSAFSLIMKNKITNFIKTYYINNINRNSIVIIVSHDDYFIDKASGINIDLNNL